MTNINNYRLHTQKCDEEFLFSLFHQSIRKLEHAFISQNNDKNSLNNAVKIFGFQLILTWYLRYIEIMSSCNEHNAVFSSFFENLITKKRYLEIDPHVDILIPNESTLNLQEIPLDLIYRDDASYRDVSEKNDFLPLLNVFLFALDQQN